MSEKKLIPFGKHPRIASINKLIDKARLSLLKYCGTTPTGEEFSVFVHDYWNIFPDTVVYPALYASLLSLAGQMITREILHQTTWRLAANIAKLKKGTPVPIWTRQSELEWVRIDILKAKLGRSARGKLGYHYDYRVMTGTPASKKFKLFWSKKYIRFLSKPLGFSRKKYPLHDGIELVGMQLFILLDPELSTEDRPAYYHFHVPSSCKLLNQRILKRRMRMLPCPEDFTLSEMLCYKCPFGYDICSAACHPTTYELKTCPRCMSTDRWFDPASNSAVCIECEESAIFEDY